MDKVLKGHTEILTKEAAIINTIKNGIWIYFLLLVFEGALRKWFLSFLATPLLIVRDPLAIWIIYTAWKHNVIKANFYVLAMSLITIIAVSTALVFGHGNIMVTFFGARILIIHFPVMFIIGKVFDLDDVIKIGKVLLVMTVVMAVLIGLQFYSPQSAWVNRGIGGDTEGAGFSGAMGYFRPSGTFSFTTGNVLFFSFSACYIFYFWLAKVKVNKIILIAATVALLAAIPLSISRTLMFSIAVTFIFTIISVASKPKFLVRMLVFVVLMAIALVILGNTPFFATATEAFTNRFEVASEVEGGVSTSLLDRFFGGMIEAITESNLPFFGYGLGMGTNVGAALLTTKGEEITFLIAEQEWLRIVGEMGFVLGILLLLLRVAFCADITIKSYQSLKFDNILPWLLLSVGLMVIMQGQWAQPTVLGFSTLIGGLILASSKITN
ncbi:hypothetical protein ACFSKN_03940 [Mariniflexile gromovii]|uniref:O-antigen ligase-like membrane protein n=1 Tax=Mariniflexile gromovii TaxID=362523 RepID=A0ABS4BUN3_9FLAO|nr:hypothetical protein [Mariniflexile gromovii]MBP0903716.1 hypothetical protein [Mariniflexile gromovii]